MPAILDEYITLTPLTCVQQVNALLNAASSRPRSFKVFYTLFGVYCGILAYRAYKNYFKRSSDVADAQPVNETLPAANDVEETNVVPAASYVSAQLPPDSSPILLQATDISNTDISWRYGLQNVSEDADDEGSSSNKSNREHAVPTASVGTSAMGKRTRKHEDKIEGEPAKTSTFSV